MEDAESVRAVCSATPTALDCTGDLESSVLILQRKLHYRRIFLIV